MTFSINKAIAPTVPSQLVLWSSYKKRLRELATRRLTLVVSLAGSGKTTYLSALYHAMAESGCRTAWLSLDPRDDDPSRFWLSLRESLLRTGLSITEPGSTEGDFSRESIADWLIGLLNQVTLLESELVVFLDNYEHITAQDIHDNLLLCIDALPENMRIVLASRVCPPFSLSRLRAQDELVEISSEDVLLDLSGTRKFIRQARNVELSHDETAILHEVTGGWITGLKLAVHACQELQRTQGFTSALTLARRYSMEFFLDEILNRMDSPVRDFLLKTSVLNWMSEPLCREVTDSQDSGLLLTLLVKSGFIQTQYTDDEVQYRYHPFFADILRKHLFLQTNLDTGALYTRASIWSERNGYLDDALQYALAADNDDRVIALIEQLMLAALNRIYGETFMLDATKLLAWLYTLPTERYGESLSYLLLNAWGFFVAIRPLESTTFLRKARQKLEQISNREEASDFSIGATEILDTIEAGNANMQSDFKLAIELAQAVLDRLRKSSVWLRVTLLCLLGESYMRVSDFEASMQVFTQAKALSTAYQSELLEGFCLYEIGRLHYISGHIARAINSWEKTVVQYEMGERLALSSIGLISVGLVRLYLSLGKTADALHYYGLATRILEGAHNLVCDLELQVARSYLLRLQGESEDAFAISASAFEKALASLNEIVPRNAAWETFVCHAKLALSTGNTAAARTALSVLERFLPLDDDYYRLQAHLISSLILQSTQHYQEALDALTEILQKAEKAHCPEVLTEAMVIRAVCYQESGQSDAAIIELLLAIETAEDDNLIQPFLVEAASLGELLHLILHGRKKKSALSMSRRLFCLGIVAARQSALNTQAQRPTTTLSRSEETVHQLLKQGLSKQEIADQLSISVNTVKTHVKNIYRKLEVHDRASASTH